MELTPAEQVVLDAVAEIQGMKRDARRVPDMARIHEIYNSLHCEYPNVTTAQILTALRSLFRKELVTHNKDVNGISMFGISTIK